MLISFKNHNFFWKIFLKHYATWTFRSYLAGLSVMEGKLCFSSPPCVCEWMAKASFVAARGFGTEVVILNDLCRDRLGLQCCASVVPLFRVLSHTPLPSVQIWAVLRTDHIRAKNDSFYDFGKCLSNQKDWSRQNLRLSWNKWKWAVSTGVPPLCHHLQTPVPPCPAHHVPVTPPHPAFSPVGLRCFRRGMQQKLWD